MARITSHVLDTMRGRPAAGLEIRLLRLGAEGCRQLASKTTDADGRVADFEAGELAAGDYRLHFLTGPYFEALALETFYPLVEIVFTVSDETQHYHVPLLLNPFGYTTYRGS